MTTAREWLEADGLGGFASGTVDLLRTRRYHALLLAATEPPTGRFVLVNGFDAYLETSRGRFALSSQAYAPGVVHPDGRRWIERFDLEPWPKWTLRFEDGTRVVQEIFAVHGASTVAVCWRLVEAEGAGIVRLSVRPLLSGRDYHALHHQNPVFRFQPERAEGGVLRFSPYPGVWDVLLVTNAEYRHDPNWFLSFLYSEEEARGLDSLEDLASPGVLEYDLGAGEAILIAHAVPNGAPSAIASPALPALERFRAIELARRKRFASRLHRAADAYVVNRGSGKTIVAGYPWFTDWGRDTFIAMRGLCIASGRLDDARDILTEWATEVTEGLLPNRFPDRGEPELNSVDAALWFIIALHDFLRATHVRHLTPKASDVRLFFQATTGILSGYARGTRHRIRLDEDGLISAGEPGLQLTWMDAKIGGHVVTPRIGKPVEVQALWLNALEIARVFSDRWDAIHARGVEAFERRFWDDERGQLHDVVDVDHQPGRIDRSFRPNQIFAVGGLPFPLLTGARAARLVRGVEERLLTPLGLRTLAPDDPAYVGRYVGGPKERDLAYHQGTVWPWLLGPFVEAWVRVRGSTPEAKREARERFLGPLFAHLDAAGLGHISEIADGDPPHPPRGCPFQAWSVGEALRLDAGVL